MGAPSGFRRASSSSATSGTASSGIACGRASRCGTGRGCTGTGSAAASSTCGSGACGRGTSACCAGARGAGCTSAGTGRACLGRTSFGRTGRSGTGASGASTRTALSGRRRNRCRRSDGKATGNHQHLGKALRFRGILSHFISPIDRSSDDGVGWQCSFIEVLRRPGSGVQGVRGRAGASQLIDDQSPKRFPSGILVQAGSDLAMKPSTSPSHVF